MVLSHDMSSCSCSVVASVPFDAVPAFSCASTPVLHYTRLCVYTTSLLLNVVVLLFCMCVPCGIHSVFAVAVSLLLCSLAHGVVRGR